MSFLRLHLSYNCFVMNIHYGFFSDYIMNYIVLPNIAVAIAFRPKNVGVINRLPYYLYNVVYAKQTP